MKTAREIRDTATRAARRALEIAAAGGHSLLLIGPPGAGKSMLARRLPGILPPMTLAESIEATRVYSAIGMLPEGIMRIGRRPFRAPHHTISDAGLLGGGALARPGEVSLAHGGVLFLDELPEFRRSALELLRGALRDEEVSHHVKGEPVKLPARFLLVAAMNPCECGWHGDASRRCVCPPGRVEGYQSRVRPYLPLFDLVVRIGATSYRELEKKEPGESSATVRARVEAARAGLLDHAPVSFTIARLAGRGEPTHEDRAEAEELHGERVRSAP